MEQLKLGVFGCGDFLRLMIAELKGSQRLGALKLYDPDRSRAEHYAQVFGATVAAKPEALFGDPELNTVALFVPPWLRKELWVQAAKAGKHILATKPMSSSLAECREMQQAATAAKVQSAVIYNRTKDAAVIALRGLFDSGAVGRLALFRQDWLHHYPSWNKWALDPTKNGGPFMDAMIHNLNIARHLMGSPLTRATLFSDKLAHPEFKGPDTEMLKADFASGGAAALFITWAADLEVYSEAGNYREHYNYQYMVTDQGWYVTFGHLNDRSGSFALHSNPLLSVRAPTDSGSMAASPDGRPVIIAKRGNETRHFPINAVKENIFDSFAAAAFDGQPLGVGLVSPQEALEDIGIIRATEAAVGAPVSFPDGRV